MILIVVLLVMGPSKIPDVARTLGKGVRAARRASQELRNAIDVDEISRPYRAWEQNHQIEDAELYTDSKCPEDEARAAQQKAVKDTVSRGDALPGPESSTATPPGPDATAPVGLKGTVSRGDSSESAGPAKADSTELGATAQTVTSTQPDGVKKDDV